MKKRFNIKVLVISLILVFGIAFIGSLFTSPATGTEWYSQNKPEITPPNYVFPIVWNILFFLIALSLYLAWTSAKNKKQKKSIAIVFGLNLILNATWSYLFFTLKNPIASLIELGILWLTIVAMIYTTKKINKNSAWLLVPYLLWVTFAGYLNYLWI